MNIDTLPDEVDFVFLAAALPEEDGLYRIALAVEGMDTAIPTLLITVTLDGALDVADRLNRRLGHDRNSWTAFAARCLRAGASGPVTGR